MKHSVIVIVSVSLLLAIVYALQAGGVIKFGADSEPDMVACTMEARQCPDGSFVGREGPQCRFAVCPAAGVGLNEVIIYGDTNIMPLSVIEDSRCPVDAECIWAGTFMAEVSVTRGDEKEVRRMSIGDRLSTSVGPVVLDDVLPAPVGNSVIGRGEYILMFTEDR